MHVERANEKLSPRALGLGRQSSNVQGGHVHSAKQKEFQRRVGDEKCEAVEADELHQRPRMLKKMKLILMINNE